MFVGFIKMRRRVIIHTRFPNPVYRKTTGIEEDGGGYTIEQDGIMFIPQEYDYSDAQNKVLIDHDVSIWFALNFVILSLDVYTCGNSFHITLVVTMINGFYILFCFFFVFFRILYY